MRKMIFLMLCTLFLTACGLVGGLVGNRSMYQEPAYTTLATLGDDVTVRQYGTRLVAEVTATNADVDKANDQAFRLLFDYISGENTSGDKIAMTVPVETSSANDSSEKIPMTTPVETSTSGNEVKMVFFFPKEYTLENAPVPKNSNITIREIEGETLAVLRKSGTMDNEKKEKRSKVLLDVLENSDWQPAGSSRAYYYDPPFTIPPLRRTEVIIPVVKKSN